MWTQIWSTFMFPCHINDPVLKKTACYKLQRNICVLHLCIRIQFWKKKIKILISLCSFILFIVVGLTGLFLSLRLKRLEWKLFSLCKSFSSSILITILVMPCTLEKKYRCVLVSNSIYFVRNYHKSRRRQLGYWGLENISFEEHLKNTGGLRLKKRVGWDV